MDQVQPPCKEVLVLASSGGGTATLGHTHPQALLQCLDDELSCIGARIHRAVYVSLSDGTGMDLADARVAPAVLSEVVRTRDNGPRASRPKNASVNERPGSPFPPPMTGSSHRQPLVLHTTMRDTLENVNTFIILNRYDEHFADLIEQGEMDALICISFSPVLFPKTLAAAAQRHLPVTGSGGASLSQAASLYNIQLVGNAGGSVGTTNWTKAVSYTSSLAKHWRRRYSFRINSASVANPTAKSVLNSCLGVFWAVCLLKAVIVPGLLSAMERLTSYNASPDVHALLFVLENWCIPFSCSVLMALSSVSTELSASMAPGLVLAAAMACASSQQSLLGSLIAGRMVAHWSNRSLFFCITHNIPATMTNLLTSGVLGAFVALLLVPVTPLLRSITIMVRDAIHWTVMQPDYRVSATAAFAWGVASCYGSKVGWYHAVHLPLVLVEMEHGDPSFLGLVDELTLVLVCAGVCVGTLLARLLLRGRTVSSADSSLCWRGLRINLVMGDFVEVCYPFMERSTFINLACYMASGLACAMLFHPSMSDGSLPVGMAYVPWPVGLLLAGEDNWQRFVVASVIATVIPMSATFLFHLRQGIGAGRAKHKGS